jgi:hypothetical protein
MNLLKDKNLFWDVDIEKLDVFKHQQFIIARAFDKGTWNDLKEISKQYSVDEIKFALQWARFLDVKTTYFISAYFDIPLERLRSYRQMQKSPPLWV